MQTGHDDDETLQPHADVDGQSNHEQYLDIGASPAKLEDLRHQHVTQEKPPIQWSVWAIQTVEDQILFVGITTVPGHESFHSIAIGDEQSSGQND